MDRLLTTDFPKAIAFTSLLFHSPPTLQMGYLRGADSPWLSEWGSRSLLFFRRTLVYSGSFCWERGGLEISMTIVFQSAQQLDITKTKVTYLPIPPPLTCLSL